MFFHFAAYSLDLAFSYDVAVTHEHNLIGNLVHFMQDVTGDNHMQPLLPQRLKQGYGFSASHGIQPVQWLVQDQHRRMVGDGLDQPDSLAHAFAVSGNSAMRSACHARSLQCFQRELMRLCFAQPAETKKLIDESVSGNAPGKGIELRAVANVAKEFFRIIGRDSANADAALRGLDEA